MAMVRTNERHRLIKINTKRGLIRTYQGVLLFCTAYWICWGAFCNQEWKEFARVLSRRVCPVVCSADRQLNRSFGFLIMFARYLLIVSFIALSPSRFMDLYYAKEPWAIIICEPMS
jgi:hypothetical protein